MCHSYADLTYIKREAAERMKETVRETTAAPAPAAEPAGGLVQFCAGWSRRCGPRNPRSPPSRTTLGDHPAPPAGKRGLNVPLPARAVAALSSVRVRV